MRKATLTGLELYTDDKIATKPGTALIFPAEGHYKYRFNPYFVGTPSRLSEVETIVLVDSKSRTLRNCSYRGPNGMTNLVLMAYDADLRVYVRRTGKQVKSHVLRAKGTAACNKSTTSKDLDSGSSLYVPTSEIAEWVRANLG